MNRISSSGFLVKMWLVMVVIIASFVLVSNAYAGRNKLEKMLGGFACDYEITNVSSGCTDHKVGDHLMIICEGVEPYVCPNLLENTVYYICPDNYDCKVTLRRHDAQCKNIPSTETTYLLVESCN